MAEKERPKDSNLIQKRLRKVKTIQTVEDMSDELLDAILMGEEVKVIPPNGRASGFILLKGYYRNGKIHFENYVHDWIRLNYSNPDSYDEFVKTCTIESLDAYDDGYPK